MLEGVSIYPAANRPLGNPKAHSFFSKIAVSFQEKLKNVWDETLALEFFGTFFNGKRDQNEPKIRKFSISCQNMV